MIKNISLKSIVVGYLFVFIAVVFWGLNFVFAKLLATDVPPAALTFWRWTIALIILSYVIPKVWKVRDQIIQHWQYFLQLAISGIVTFHICIYIAAHTSSAYALPLIAAFSGVFAMFGHWILGNRPTRHQSLGALLATSGLLMLISKGDFVTLLKLEITAGDIWMLVASASWAYYSLTLEKKPIDDTQVNSLTAILFAMPILAFLYATESVNSVGFEVNWQIVSIIIYLAVFPSVICYWLWNRAIETIGAMKVHAMYYTIPIVTAIEARIIIGEELFYYHAIAAVAIIIGAFLTSRTKKI